MTKPRLIVLPPSHYCERARWALDHTGVTYAEERWAVGLHVPRARRIATGTTLPILVADGAVIQGSGAILDWTGMAGGDAAVERRLVEVTGVLVRRFVYAGTLGVKGSGIRDGLLDGVPAGQARLARLLWPGIRRLMATAMDARPALLPELTARLAAELDWLDAALGAKRHLVGDRFGRADLTAASLLAPLARPVDHPAYRGLCFPEAMERLLAPWRARPSLRWVERIYAEHRRAPRVGDAAEPVQEALS